MFRRILMLGFICLLSLTILITCSKKTTEPVDDNEPLAPIVSGQVVVLDPAMIPYFEFAEDHILFPTLPGIPLPSLDIDMILVSPPCPEAPNGFLRRITGMKKTSRGTEYSTTDAALDEVFEQGDIVGEDQDLETTRIVSSQAMCDGVTFVTDAKDPRKFSYNVNMSLSRFGVSLNLNGPITFSQSFGFNARIRWFQLSRINFTSHTLQSIDLDATLSPTALNSSVAWDTTLFRHQMSPYTFWIGPVPIVIVPVISVDLYVTASGEVYVGTNMTQSQTIDAGIHYNKSSSPRWSSSWDRQVQNPVFTPLLSGTGNLEVGAGPKLSCLLYGLVGPFAGAYGYLNLEVAPLEIPWWTLSLGGKVSLGIDLKKISRNLPNPSFDVLNISTPIAQADANQCIAPIYSPIPGLYHTTPQTVTISSPTSGVTIRYTMDGSVPDASSPVYSAPLEITESTTLKAKAFKEGMTSSQVTTAAYTIVLYYTEAPVISPPGGVYELGQNVSVSLSCPTPNAIIRYTTDGSVPTSSSPIYSSPINVQFTSVINAIAFKTGWMPSPMESAAFSIGSLDDDFIYVQGGSFNNGMSLVPNVSISSFYIDKYELSQEKYQVVMGVNPSYNNGNPDYPVEKVTWFNAIEFCNRASIREGRTPCYSYLSYGTNPDNWPAGWNTDAANHVSVSCNWSAGGYRLPTEAEWHFTAKGGNLSNGYLYSGSNTLGDIAWHLTNSGFPPSTKLVGTKAANELGFHDMSGNVWEWVWDIYGNYPSPGLWPEDNPHGAVAGTYRVLRGASILCHSGYFPLLHRNYLNATYEFMDVGFRICRNNN
jgi:formylglycine-generating enzyme